MAAAAPAAGKALTALLKKAPDASHPVAQDCFRLLAGAAAGGQKH
jgi:U3 small nucleolar RNA-associated protein 20